MILVLDPDVEQHTSQRAEHPGEPRRHRIGIDRQRNSRSRTFASTHLSHGLGLQQRRLRGQPQQRSAGGSCRTRLFPHHQHLAHPLLECLDPLTHRRRGDMQHLRRRVKAAELDHRGPPADNDQLCPTTSSTTALTAKSSDPAEQCSAPGRCRLLSSWVLERRRGLRAGSRFRCRGVRAAHLPSQHQSCFGRGATGLLQTCAGTRLLI